MRERDAGTPEVVRWYTRARKFPQLIGRTPDGAKLWGGPYTITQAVGAGVVLFTGINTMGLWAVFGFVGNLIVLLLVAYTVVWGLGRIPVGSRNPLTVVAGACRAVWAPRHGRVDGKPVRIRRPHRIQHRLAVAIPSTPGDPVESPSGPATVCPSAGPPADNRPATARRPALTGVQALLAASPHRSESENSP